MLGWLAAGWAPRKADGCRFTRLMVHVFFCFDRRDFTRIVCGSEGVRSLEDGIKCHMIASGHQGRGRPMEDCNLEIVLRVAAHELEYGDEQHRRPGETGSMHTDR